MFEIDELAKIFDYVIVSPGVSPDNIFFKQAVLQNILLCDIDLLYLKFPNAFCIGVTGTNRKSTSVTLLQRAINSCGLNYVLGAILVFALQIYPRADGYVIELFSYQLDLMSKSCIKNVVRPDICVLLNIKPCHLDRYKLFENYVKSKGQMFNFLKPNSIAIVCLEDEKSSCINLVRQMQEKKIYVLFCFVKIFLSRKVIYVCKRM